MNQANRLHIGGYKRGWTDAITAMRKRIEGYETEDLVCNLACVELVKSDLSTLLADVETSEGRF